MDKTKIELFIVVKDYHYLESLTLFTPLIFLRI